MTQIQYVAKKALHPKFGFNYPNRDTIQVRIDLPKSVIDFVIEHERYHLTDKSTWWVWREIKANWHAALRHPLGGLYTAALSLSPARIGYYISRFCSGEQLF
ncbi:MAG: hypothetical protein ABIL58_10435 [Pseudomonadota bacterium]